MDMYGVLSESTASGLVLEAGGCSLMPTSTRRRVLPSFFGFEGVCFGISGFLMITGRFFS